MHTAYEMPEIMTPRNSVAMQRAAHRQWVLKPQDLAVAFKLVALKGEWLAYATLGKQLRLSQFEVHAAVGRLAAARLVIAQDRGARPNMALLRNFAISGAPFAYPPVRGEITIGFATAHAVPPLKELMQPSEELPPVWPHPEGNARGQGLLPLYEALPLAAQDDAYLYELLALFDALRIGQARERELAAKLLQERIR